jgi:surface antigen
MLLRRSSLMILLLALSAIFAMAPAAADPLPWLPHQQSFDAKDFSPKPKHQKVKKKKGKYKKMKKKKHKSGGYQEIRVYVQPIDLNRGRCNHDLIGAILGGHGGAAIGSQIGQGDGRTAAIIGGTILGAIVGGQIGRAMDATDHNCVGQGLEHVPDGRSIAWTGSDGRSNYEMRPVRTFRRQDGGYCREYTTTAVVGGQPQQTRGTACRQPDGAWRIVN